MLLAAGFASSIGRDTTASSAADTLSLADYYDLARGYSGAALAYAQEKNTGVQNLVSQCMKDEGFVYTPNPVTGMFVLGNEAPRPDDRDWVGQFGYGIIYDSNGSYWEQSAKMSELTIRSTQVDLNGDYVRSLTKSEQDAYVLTLTGTHVAAGEVVVGSDDFLDPADPKDAAHIAEMSAAEVKQALADLGCRESTHYAERRAQAVTGIEAQFIAEHRGELDALRNAAEQSFTQASASK
jgi:hypothetical protein